MASPPLLLLRPVRLGAARGRVGRFLVGLLGGGKSNLVCDRGGGVHACGRGRGNAHLHLVFLLEAILPKLKKSRKPPCG